MVVSDQEPFSNPYTQSVAFNMGIATLFRIDNLLQRVSAYQILNNKLLTQRCLSELYKELYPFLTDPEKQAGTALWLTIVDSGLSFNTGKLVRYNKTLSDNLDAWDFWIRQKLYDKGLLMAKGDNDGLIIGKFQ
jgi:hypothetical protein